MTIKKAKDDLPSLWHEPAVKPPCLYPLSDGRRCLECSACQPEDKRKSAEMVSG